MTTLRQMGAKIGSRVRFIEDPEGQWRTVKTDAELDYEHLLPWVVENRTMTDTTHDDLVQAAVAAKLTEAASEIKRDADDDYISHGAAHWAAETILALITPDAQAALDRVVAAERERCAKVAQHCADFADTNGDYLLICNVVAAIREGGE